MSQSRSRTAQIVCGFFILGVAAAFLLACGSGPTPTPIIVVVTNTFTPAPQVTVVTATFTAPPPSPAPTLPATATPSPRAGPFRLVTPDQGLPEGDINDLWPAPDGAVWLAGGQGVYRHAGGAWTQLLSTPCRGIQGADDQGRVWVIEEGEGAISAYEPSGVWTRYGPGQGWLPPPEHQYLSPRYGDGLATDAQGHVWLATGRDDLRRFDPTGGTWTALTATQLGYEPPEEEGYQGHFLADVAGTAGGQVWLGDCMGMGESFLGQGVRIMEPAGGSWQGEPDTVGECVLDLEVDGVGNVYAGGFDALQVYEASAGTWSRIPLPPWDRKQLVRQIDLDPAGNPWVEIIRYGGASAFGAIARYHLEAGSWVQDFDGWLSDVAFDIDGTPWLCSESAVYRLGSTGPDLVDTVGGSDCRIAVDPEGVVWVASYTGLWRLDP